MQLNYFSGIPKGILMETVIDQKVNMCTLILINKEMKLLLFLILTPVSIVLAQSRSIYFKLTDIQTDTVKKQIVFHYRLGNIAPKDSLGVSIRRASGKIIKLNAVYGDIGTTLTDGRRKTIVWNPIADRQKFDEDVAIVFTVKTDDEQGITRKQSIDLVRWTVNAGLIGYSLVEGISILSIARDYNRAMLPISNIEKDNLDERLGEIQQRQQRFYWVAGISTAALLINSSLSLIQSTYKLRPNRFGLAGSQRCVGLTYKF